MFKGLIETQGVRWGGPNIPSPLSGGGAECVSFTQEGTLVQVIAEIINYSDVIRSNQSPYNGTGSNGGDCIEADVSSAKTGDFFHGCKIKATVESVSPISPQEIDEKFAEITDVAGCDSLLRSRETSGSECDNNRTTSLIASVLSNLGCSEQQAWRLASQPKNDYDKALLHSIVSSGKQCLTLEEQEEAAAIAETPRRMEVTPGLANLGNLSLFAKQRTTMKP